MKFRLNPPSGYPNSYLDIKFVVELDKSAEISFVNESTGESLVILSTSSGYIRNEMTIAGGELKIEGYINLFNDDKMNTRLRDFAAVEISCIAVVNGQQREKMTVSFFNESKSLDAGIVPFELQVVNPSLNIESNDVLQLTVVSNDEKKYELAIKPSIGNESCTIEIACRKGQNIILVPSEVLYSDLRVSEFRRERYIVNYVKFEGLDFHGYVNRQYIPIAGAEIRFVGTRLMPIPQKRIGPDQSLLSKDFVLSDRYYVPTWKDFSSFGRRMENVLFICNFPRFLHEMQDLRDRESVMTASRAQLRTISQKQQENYDVTKNRLFRYVNTNPGQRMFFEDIAGRVFAHSRPNVVPSSFGQLAKSGGCGCSRKK